MNAVDSRYGTFSVADPKQVRYRCSKGHEWEETLPPGVYGCQEGIVFSLEPDNVFCLRCLLEFARQHAGTVERAD